MFSSYIVHPQNCQFEGQDPDENILLLLRAHPITNIPWIVLAFLLIISPFFIPKFLPFTGLELNFIPNTFVLIFLIINYLIALMVIFEGFLTWYFNVTLVTSEKVIDIDFAYLLYKAVNLAPLSKIEETDSVTAGLLGTIFNFGNVRVQTAGENVAIEMKNVPHAAQVADMILDLAGKPHEHIMGVPGIV